MEVAIVLTDGDGRELPSPREVTETPSEPSRDVPAYSSPAEDVSGQSGERVAASETLAVVEFASLAFIVVFGTVSALAFVNRDETDIRTLPTVVGMVGSAAFFVMLLYFLYTRLPHVFFLVVVIAVAVFTVEGAYFKRDSIREGIREVEKEV